MARNGVTSPDSSMRFGSDPQASGGYLPESQLRQIIRDILMGLEEVHRQDIVHLDIKPENILLGKSGKYKLADLGMSRLLTKITDPHTLPEGDCRYLARELLSREVLQHLPDLKKSDIFSLGITAYELISLANLEKNGQEWQALREGKVKFPPHAAKYYSEELLETVCRMLSPITDDRPGARELLETAFISSKERRIQEVNAENEHLKDQLCKLTEYLRLNHGLDAASILQSLS
jgi:wee1-like protein kinase